MIIDIFIKAEIPDPKGKFTKIDLLTFVSSHLFSGVIKDNSPFKGKVEKIEMFIKTEND